MIFLDVSWLVPLRVGIYGVNGNTDNYVQAMWSFRRMKIAIQTIVIFMVSSDLTSVEHKKKGGQPLTINV